MTAFRMTVRGNEAQARKAVEERGGEVLRCVGATEHESCLSVETSLAVLCEWFCETNYGDLKKPDGFPVGTLLFYIDEESNKSDWENRPPLVMAKPIGFDRKPLSPRRPICHCRWPCDH